MSMSTTTPSELLLRSTLLKDELKKKDSDLRRHTINLLPLNIATWDAPYSYSQPPKTISCIISWLWNETDQEITVPSRPSAPVACPSTASSLPISSPQFGPPKLHRHAWSVDSVPKVSLSLASPSSSFDARHASQQCKQINGYVSFAAIEGLGMPTMEEDLNKDDSPDDKWSWLKKPWKT